MVTGNSQGDPIGEPAPGADSVITAGSFPSHLDDDQIMLQLMNNHVIQEVAERYQEAVRRPQRTIDSITEGVQSEIAYSQDLLDRDAPQDESLVSGARLARLNRADETAVRRLNDARDDVTALRDAMDEAIVTELQVVSDTFSSLSQVLNAQNSTSANIRNRIAEIDAQIDGLAEQAHAVAQIRERYSNQPMTFNARTEDYSRVAGMVADLDGSGVAPPDGHIRGGPSFTQFETWDDYIRNQNVFGSIVNAMDALDLKSVELRDRMTELADQYPDVYKQYLRLLNGKSVSEQTTDWWKIATTALWIVAEEAAWFAAGAILAPVTGGIGTAIIVSARMARRAGQVGRMVSSGIMAGVNVARWWSRLEDRVANAVLTSFGRAWSKVKTGVWPRRGDPGGNVNGNGRASTTPRCRNGVCAPVGG